MIFDAEESTQFEKWRQAAVIAHEVVHIWFGNLLTCNWWNDLWLNEGFARYMQFVGAEHSGEDFGSLQRQVIDTIQLAMDFDVTAAAVPVWSEVVDQVVVLPTRSAYEKPGALLRMIQGFLTENTFIRGLQEYLKAQ